MHRALSILDTLSIILSYLRKKKDILSCAMACRPWFHPATERLSQHAHKVTDILGVFSAAGILKISRTKNRGLATYDATGQPPKQADWDRFYYYSQKIQSLYPCHVALSTACVELLSKPLHDCNGPLFPLIDNVYGEICFLQEISLLQFIFSHSPGLSTLILSLTDLKEIPEAFWMRFNTMVQFLTQLECFSMTTGTNVNIPSTIFATLAHLPKVTSISGRFDADMELQVEPGAFPCLERMAWRSPLTPKFFHASWFPPPRMGYLTLPNTTADSLQDLITSTALWEAPIKLEAVIKDPFCPSHLHTISSLRCLETLILSLQGGITIRDEDFGVLATGLPRLRHLSFYTIKNEGAVSPLVSHRSIEKLIRHCADLKYLLILFDTTDILPVTSPLANHELPAKVAPHLRFSPLWSRVTDTVNVAAWLIACCGKAKRPAIVAPYSDPLWAEVSRLLRRPNETLEPL